MNADLMKFLSVVLKHVGEAPNILAKGQSLATAVSTKGADKIDPACDFLQALKPLEADLIAGGFMAVHGDPAALRASFEAAQPGVLQKLLDLFANNPQLLAIMLKLFGLAI